MNLLHFNFRNEIKFFIVLIFFFCLIGCGSGRGSKSSHVEETSTKEKSKENLSDSETTTENSTSTTSNAGEIELTNTQGQRILLQQYFGDTLYHRSENIPETATIRVFDSKGELLVSDTIDKPDPRYKKLEPVHFVDRFLFIDLGRFKGAKNALYGKMVYDFKKQEIVKTIRGTDFNYSPNRQIIVWRNRLRRFSQPGNGHKLHGLKLLPSDTINISSIESSTLIPYLFNQNNVSDSFYSAKVPRSRKSIQLFNGYNWSKDSNYLVVKADFRTRETAYLSEYSAEERKQMLKKISGDLPLKGYWVVHFAGSSLARTKFDFIKHKKGISTQKILNTLLDKNNPSNINIQPRKLDFNNG